MLCGAILPCLIEHHHATPKPVPLDWSRAHAQGIDLGLSVATRHSYTSVCVCTYRRMYLQRLQRILQHAVATTQGAGQVPGWMALPVVGRRLHVVAAVASSSARTSSRQPQHPQNQRGSTAGRRLFRRDDADSSSPSPMNNSTSRSTTYGSRDPRDKSNKHSKGKPYERTSSSTYSRPDRPAASDRSRDSSPTQLRSSANSSPTERRGSASSSSNHGSSSSNNHSSASNSSSSSRSSTMERWRPKVQPWEPWKDETDYDEGSAAAKRRDSVLAARSNFSMISNTTLIPRDPTIQDGPWAPSDDQLVQEAQQQAQQVDTSIGTALAAVAGPDKLPPGTEEIKGLVLLGLTEEELRNLARKCNLEGFRGTQIYQGLAKGAPTWEKVPGLPDKDIKKLQERGIQLGRSKVYSKVKSPDGTVKLLLQLPDFRLVEAVGIPMPNNKLTVCVSSQVGCPMRCTFCATGKGGFARNLKPHEIMDQVLHVQTVCKKKPSNVVFMGMGEPLLNLPAVIAATKYFQTALHMSGRAITISTVGVPNAIAKLAAAQLTATLAVSIHAPNQALREQLIPSAKAYPLEALMEDCQAYFKATGRRISFEYTLMAGMNDAPEHAKELAALLRRYDMATHVNVIPWNPVDESEYQRPSKDRVKAFVAALEGAGMTASVRTTRGLEAAAACGQLRNQHQKVELPEGARVGAELS